MIIYQNEQKYASLRIRCSNLLSLIQFKQFVSSSSGRSNKYLQNKFKIRAQIMARYTSQRTTIRETAEQPLLSEESRTVEQVVSQKISSGSASGEGMRPDTQGGEGSQTQEQLAPSNAGSGQGPESRKESGKTATRMQSSVVAVSGYGSASPLLGSGKDSQRRPEEERVSDVDSSLERYRARQTRNYERRTASQRYLLQQRKDSSRSRLSTEIGKRMESQIVHDQPLAAQMNEVTTQNSEDLDPKFIQHSDIELQLQLRSDQACGGLNLKGKVLEACQNEEAHATSKKCQSLSSRDYVISNSVALVEERRHFSNQVPSKDEMLLASREPESNEKERRPEGKASEENGISPMVTNSEPRIPLSGLTSSVPLTDLDLTQQSRLLQSQNTQKAQSGLQQKLRPEAQFMQPENALEMFTIEQATLPSQLGATSTMKEDNLQFLQLNVGPEDAKEASAAYGYGNSAFEGTLGVASGPSRGSNNRNMSGSSANEVMMCGPMQMSAEHLLVDTLRSEDRPASWTCNENQMQGTTDMNYIEQTLKLNANAEEKARTNEKSAKGDSVAVLDRHVNVTEYGDVASIGEQLRQDDPLRANTSRKEPHVVAISEAHRPSTILQVSEGLHGLNTWESQENSVGLKPSKAYPSHHAILHQEAPQGLFANIQTSSQASGTMTPQYPQTGTAGQHSLNGHRSSDRGQNSRMHSRNSSNGDVGGPRGSQLVYDNVGVDHDQPVGRNTESYYVTLEAEDANHRSNHYWSYVQTDLPSEMAVQQPPNFQVICFIGAQPERDEFVADSRRPSRAMTVMTTSSHMTQPDSRRPSHSIFGIGGGLISRQTPFNKGRQQRHYTDSIAASKERSHVSSWLIKKPNHLSGTTSKASLDRFRPPSHGSRRNTQYAHPEEHERQSNSHRSKSQYSGVQCQSEYHTRKEQAQGRFFTTTNEISSVIFKQNGRAKGFIKPQLRQVLLNSQTDIEKFIVAATRQTKSKSHEGINYNMRQYQFDLCLNSEQHTASSMIVTKEFLAKKMLAGSQRSQKANTVVILFGSEHTLKSRDMSPTSPDSFMKKLFDMLSERKDAITDLKAQLFLQDKAIDLLEADAGKTKNHFGKIDYKRAKQLVAQALRTRSQVIQQMQSHDPKTALLTRTCSHLAIQINDVYIIELGDLEGLAFTAQPDIVRCLADDFGSMTNEILRQSLFYQDYDFFLSPAQKASKLNHLLQAIISKQSKVSIFAYLSPLRRHEHCSLTALDFAHKLRQYFYGSHDFCRIPQVLQNFAMKHSEAHVDLLRAAFQVVDGVFERIDAVQDRIEELCGQVERLKDVTLSKKRLAAMKRQKEEIVGQTRAVLSEAASRMMEVQAMRANGDGGEEGEPVIDRAKIELFQQAIGDRVVEIQATTQEVERILLWKGAGRNEGPTIFTTFGDEERLEPSDANQARQAAEIPKQVHEQHCVDENFDSKDFRQEFQQTIRHTIKHSNSATFLRSNNTRNDDSQEDADREPREDRAEPRLLSKSSRSSGKRLSRNGSPSLQQLKQIEYNSKEFYLLNESVHRGIFNELASHSTQRLTYGGTGWSQAEQIHNSVPPPCTGASKQKAKAQNRPRQPPLPLRMPSRKARSNNRPGSQSSEMHHTVAARRPKRKKVVLNSMSVGRPTFSSRQRLQSVIKSNNANGRSSSPHPTAFGAKALSQSMMSRMSRSIIRGDETRFGNSKANQEAKKKTKSASRSTKTGLAITRPCPNLRRSRILPISRGSQASCRRVINITIDPEGARDNSYEPQVHSAQQLPNRSSNIMKKMATHHQQRSKDKSNVGFDYNYGLSAVAAGTAGSSASQFLDVMRPQTLQSHDHHHNNTSYLLSMNYSQTSGQLSAQNHQQKLAAVGTQLLQDHVALHGDDPFEGLYRSYQVKEDYNGNPIGHGSGRRPSRNVSKTISGVSCRSRSNCEATKTLPQGPLSQALSAHSKNSKSAEAMPNVIHVKNQRTPPLSTRRVSNSQDLQDVLLAEEILRVGNYKHHQSAESQLKNDKDHQREEKGGIWPYRNDVLNLDKDPNCNLKQAQSQDAFQLIHPTFHDIKPNKDGIRTVAEPSRSLEPQNKMLNSDTSVQHQFQFQPLRKCFQMRKSLLDFVNIENQLRLWDRTSGKSESNKVSMSKMSLHNENMCLKQLLQSLQEENQMLRGNQEHLAIENQENKEQAENERIKEKLLQKYQRKLSKTKQKVRELREENQAFKECLQSQDDFANMKEEFKQIKEQMQSRIQFLQSKAKQTEKLNGVLSSQYKKAAADLLQCQKDLKTAKARNLQYLYNKNESEMRDERIAEIKLENQQLQNDLKEKDSLIKKLKSRMAILEQRQSAEAERKAQQTQQIAQNQKSEKEGKLEQKLKTMKKRYLDLEADMEQKDAQIDEVNKARDKYREQVLLLKQEIRVLKRELGQESTISMTDDSILKTNREGRANEGGKFEELLMEQNLHRKNQALREMEALVRDLSPNQQQSFLQSHQREVKHFEEEDELGPQRLDGQSRVNGKSRVPVGAVQLRSREIESSSQKSESLANGQMKYDLVFENEYRDMQTPQPRQYGLRQSQERKASTSQDSIGIMMQQENEATGGRRRAVRREVQTSRLRHDSQRSKGGVAFETQLTTANDEPAIVTNVTTGETDRNQAARCPEFPAINRLATPVDDCRFEKQGAGGGHANLLGKHGKRPGQFEAACRTRNDSASSRGSTLSDQLDGGPSFFNQHSIPVEDTADLLKSSHNLKDVNKTMQDTKERSLLISEKIVDRVTERIMAKLTMAEGGASASPSIDRDGLARSRKLYDRDNLDSVPVSNLTSLAKARARNYAEKENKNDQYGGIQGSHGASWTVLEPQCTFDSTVQQAAARGGGSSSVMEKTKARKRRTQQHKQEI